MAKVEIYTTPTCPYCAAAKSLLSRKGVSYQETDVSRDPQIRVAMTQRASVEGTGSPRRSVTRKSRPSSAWAAVAPRHTITRGSTAKISASNHGRQARTWCGRGFLKTAPCSKAPARTLWFLKKKRWPRPCRTGRGY